MRLGWIAFFSFFGFALSAACAEKIVARVVDVKGNAFAFAADGSSKRLVFGGRILDMAEVMVDDSSYVSVLDSSGNEHHLSGGTYAKFYNKLLEVKNGSVWSVVQNAPSLLNTVNSVVKSSKGQFIVTVDSAEGKTQLLSLSGEARLSSALEPQLSTGVPAGHFSFIDRSYESGLPRAATRVGLRSYQQIKHVFAKVKALEKNNFETELFGPGKKRDEAPARAIASVGARAEKGQVIYLSSGAKIKRMPASSQKTSATEYYQSLRRQKKNGKAKSKSAAKIRYFGVDFSKSAQPSVKSITSASVKTIEKKAKKRQVTIHQVKRNPASREPSSLVGDINSVFEKSLGRKLERNKRHPDEVNQLIDELKSFNQDYSKHY